jgi:O-methyltransferase
MGEPKGRMIKSAIHRSFRAFGLDITRRRHAGVSYPPDFCRDEIDLIEKVRLNTMTSEERIFALIQATRYVSANGIPGAVVECGVWKGGSMAAVAKVLLKQRDVERDLYLFDTFEGMSAPSSMDIEYSGKRAEELLNEETRYKCNDAPLDYVKGVLYETDYPKDKIRLVKGRVEDTIPAVSPDAISLLRLDTDWYESTKHELVHLFPRLSPGGVILIDDYGHWKGARQACDEYFAEHRVPILLNRIDYTGRIGVKP